MNREMLLGLVRHVLTIAGGVLAQRGALDPTDLETIVGAVCALAGVAWSLAHKRQAKESPK